jgi:hemolysin III
MILLRDPVSSLSHFLMAAIAIFVSLFLMRISRGAGPRRTSILIFAICSIVLYSASGLFHALRLPADELLFFQLLDMSAIYLMIAGSVTPMAVILVRGRLKRMLLVGEWGFALVGILALWFLPKPDHTLLVSCYLGMAWFGCAGLGQYWRATGSAGMRWFAATVGIYIAGALVDLAKWPIVWPGVIQAHEVLHFCDIGGTACYLVFLVKYVIPYYSPEAATQVRPAPFAAPAQA